MRCVKLNLIETSLCEPYRVGKHYHVHTGKGEACYVFSCIHSACQATKLSFG